MAGQRAGVVNCPQVFMEKSEEKSEEGSHVELLDQIKELVHQLMADPFLNDLSFDISLDELQSQLALEQGHAMTVNVRRLDDVIIPIVVLQGATVNDLIKNFQKEMVRRLARSGKTSHISWHYVWKTNYFIFQHQKLVNRNAKLSSYGISNNDEVNFIKRLHREDRPKLTQRYNKRGRGRGRKNV